MNEEKRAQIKSIMISRDGEEGLAKKVMEEFIFGPLGKSEHYAIDDFVSIYNEIQAEKVPVQEAAIEEPAI